MLKHGGATRLLLASALGVVLVLVGWAVARRAADQAPPAVLEGREQVASMLHDHPQTFVPAVLPDRTRRLGAVLAQGLPQIDVYQDGEPAVTVCSAVRAACLAAVSGARVLREGTVGDQPFVVLVNATEDPAGRNLSQDSAAFWLKVSLAHEAPWVRAR